MEPCSTHKEESVVFKQCCLSFSPIGAVANEFDGLKVALQRFPARRGAGCSALNDPKPAFSRRRTNKHTRHDNPRSLKYTPPVLC